MEYYISKRLKRDFFNRNCTDVARDLLGQILIFHNYAGIIIETEAYRGTDDPASHAFRGPTPRASIMFGPSGMSYVYLIYGMYHCLNIVTEEVGSPSAVLIRGLKLIKPHEKLLDGPGKICRELQITKQHNNINLTNQEDFYVAENKLVTDFNATPRIGIKVGMDKLWRFITKL